ncbi:MAG TPA: hypothetical protein VEE82_01405 [Thermodesulfovibrionales bacterium]|nr:hypothetical protein [Thermodesulfovibrionales bacterium]
MWKRVKESLDSGIEKVKWFSTLLNERVKVEISLFGLLHQSAEMEKKRTALLKTIGERVFELRNLPEKQILEDPVIKEAKAGVERLSEEIAELRRKASEIEKIEV